MRRRSIVLSVVAVLLTFSFQLLAEEVVQLPCPDPKPKFDHTKIDRTIKKEPEYGGKPAYRFWACGPEGKQIIAMVADESKGAGTGVDTLYVDFNANRDLTDEGEKFSPKKTVKMNLKARGMKPGWVTVNFGWANSTFEKKKINVNDPKFEYYMKGFGGFFYVEVRLKDKSWWTHSRFSDHMPWGTTRENAPVFRLGGEDWMMGNDRFIVRGRRSKDTLKIDIGRKVTPGMNIRLNGTYPFFAGSTPMPGARWVAGGHKNMRAWIEFIDHPDEAPIKLDFHET
jgi:hypothetical protein